MKNGKHIDWLSITLDSDKVWRNFLPFADLRLEGRGRHGYAKAYVDNVTGARIETDALDERMGTHVTLSSEVLDNYRREHGMEDDALCNRIQDWDARCSRIDLAIDIFGASCTPGMLNSALTRGVAKIPARTWRFIDGHRQGINGTTIDTGSSASDRRFRFYDKRAEQRIKDGETWVRLELQLRRLYARSTLGACVEHGVITTTTAQIGSYLEWSHPDYLGAIAGDTGNIVTLPQKLSNRQRWLTGQVAKALAAEITIHPDFLMQFMIAVRHFGETLDKAGET